MTHAAKLNVRRQRRATPRQGLKSERRPLEREGMDWNAPGQRAPRAIA